jgi:hypothetical protein
MKNQNTKKKKLFYVIFYVSEGSVAFSADQFSYVCGKTHVL